MEADLPPDDRAGGDGVLEVSVPAIKESRESTAVDDGGCAETEKGGSDQNGNHHGGCAETEKGGSDPITVSVHKH